MADVSVEFGAKDTGLEATLKTVQAEMSRLETEIKSGELSFNQLSTAMRDLAKADKVSQQLQSIGASAAGASPQVDKLGKDGKEMGDDIKKGSDKGGMSLGELGIAAGIAGVAVKAGMALAEAAMNGVRAVAAGFGDAIDLGGRLTDLSSRTGESAGNLLVLERAFTNTGVSAEAVGSSMNKLQKFMAEAAQGGAAQSESMQRLGLTMGDLAGKTPTEQMAVFAKQISGIQDPAQRAEAAMSIFGKSGGQLLPILNNFSGEIEGAKDQLGGLPGVMDRSAAAFDGVGDSMAAINSKVMEFAAGFLEDALPALTTFTNALSGIDAAGWGQAAMNKITKIADTLMGAFKDPLGAIQAWGTAYEAGYKALANGLLNGGVTFIDFVSNALQTQLPSAIGSFITQGFIDSALTFSRYLTEALMTFSTGLSDLPGFEALGQKMLTTLGSANDSIIAQQLENIGKTEAAAARVVAEFGKAAEKTTVFKEDFFGAEEATKRMNEKFSELAASGAATRESLTTAMIPVEEGAKKVTAEMQTQLDITAKINASKQAELDFELAMAEAKGTGNKEEIEALTKKKEWLDAWKKAIASGMGEDQAAAFANNLGAAKINADNIKVPAFTSAKQDAKEIETSLGNSKSFLEAMGKIEKVKAIEETKLSAKEARAEIEAFGNYMNVDLKGMAFPDIAKKLGVDKMGEAGSDQIKTIMDFVSNSKDKLSVNPIDSEKFNNAWQGIRDTIEGTKTILDVKADTTDASAAITSAVGSINSNVTTQTDDNNIQSTRATIEQGVADIPITFTVDPEQIKKSIGTIDISGGAGGGVLSSIETLVSTIQGYVETIRDRLPMTALA